MNSKALIRSTNQLTNKFELARQEIMDKHPNFDKIKDSRITIFTNCILTLDGTYISFMVREFELWEDEWWIKMGGIIGDIRTPAPKSMFIKGFDSFTITAYFSLLFNALENGFRSFYKALFPSKTIPGFFLCVYKDILTELVADEIILTEYLQLIKILRLIRNAEIHNNGIHVDSDDKVTWNGMTVIFKKGEHIDYGGRDLWNVVLALSDGILDVLKQVVNSNKIMKEPRIIDASYADL
jgi:hypothetical protein